MRQPPGHAGLAKAIEPQLPPVLDDGLNSGRPVVAFDTGRDARPYGMFQIPGEAEKGGRNRLLPMAEEFEEMLLAVPESDRSGFVFNAGKIKAYFEGRASRDSCSRFISNLGEKAGVVVDRKGDEVKFASVHDLRWSFGVQWASRVPHLSSSNSCVTSQ